MPGPLGSGHQNTAMQTHLAPGLATVAAVRKSLPEWAMFIEPIIKANRENTAYDVALQVVATLQKAGAIA